MYFKFEDKIAVIESANGSQGLVALFRCVVEPGEIPSIPAKIAVTISGTGLLANMMTNEFCMRSVGREHPIGSFNGPNEAILKHMKDHTTTAEGRKAFVALGARWNRVATGEMPLPAAMPAGYTVVRQYMGTHLPAVSKAAGQSEPARLIA